LADYHRPQDAILMPHTFVGRTPASAAGPLAGRWVLIKTSTSRARAPGAGQGTRPTDSMRKWEKYVASVRALPKVCGQDPRRTRHTVYHFGCDYYLDILSIPIVGRLPGERGQIHRVG